ncbi:MAG: patatin-like phospholipase family protein, partial [Gemmatimonadota bacterium]
GSSMGAIIGGLYASGYSGKEIDSLARALPLSGLFRTYEPRVPLSLGQIQPLVVWEQNNGRLVFQRAAVLEPEVNALLDAGFLRGNLLALGNFDSLPIPFRAVATDLLSGKPHVFESGDLALAVRASAAIPLLLEPELLKGRFLGDGGLSANIPITIARAVGVRRIILSNTTESRPDSLNLQSAIVMLDHLIGTLFLQAADSLGPDDVVIRPDVDGFQSLNFATQAIDRLIHLGRDAAVDALADQVCLRQENRAPAGGRARPPRIGDITFDHVTEADSAYLQNTLGLVPGSILEFRPLQARLRAFGSSTRYTSLWLYPNGTRDSISFRIVARPTPARVLAVSAVYDNDLGGRVWVGNLQRNFLGSGLEAVASTSLGERRQELNAALRLHSMAQVAIVPVTEVEISRELVRRFQHGEDVAALKVHAGRSFIGVETDWRNGWHSSLGLELHWWREVSASAQDQFAAGPQLRIIKSGPLAETLFSLDASATHEYARLAIEGIATITLGRLKVRPHGRFGYGEDLPVHLQFALGGTDGFAGLHIGEQRNSREAMGSLIMLYPVRGKLWLRVEPMVGATSNVGSLFPEGALSVGARVGLDLATSLGPIRVEYGVGEKGRDALLVRMGRWF